MRDQLNYILYIQRSDLHSFSSYLKYRCMLNCLIYSVKRHSLCNECFYLDFYCTRKFYFQDKLNLLQKKDGNVWKRLNIWATLTTSFHKFNLSCIIYLSKVLFWYLFYILYLQAICAFQKLEIHATENHVHLSNPLCKRKS